MQFIHAFHKTDFNGTDQTIGVSPDGQVWLAAGLTDPGANHDPYAQFAPEHALRFALQMAELAQSGARIKAGLPDVHEQGTAVILTSGQRARLDWAVIDVAAAVAGYMEAVARYDSPGGSGRAREDMHECGRRLGEARRALLTGWAAVARASMTADPAEDES